MKRVDFAKAKQAFREFKFGLQRHIIAEETILFPLFEDKSGLTDTLRSEHEEIRERVAVLDEKIRQNDADSAHEVDRLVNELGGHNAREEHPLYPQLDKLLSAAEKQDAFAAMSAVPQPTS